MPGGRPSSYNKQTCDEICNRLALGESLRTICKSEHLPNISTILDWISKHSEFSEQYARAREQQQEFYAEEILDIADNGQNDYMERLNKNGEVEMVVNYENIQRSRLRVDTRKWIMSKLAPKKYGDKVTQELTGKDGAELIVNVNISEKTK